MRLAERELVDGAPSMLNAEVVARARLRALRSARAPLRGDRLRRTPGGRGGRARPPRREWSSVLGLGRRMRERAQSPIARLSSWRLPRAGPAERGARRRPERPRVLVLRDRLAGSRGMGGAAEPHRAITVVQLRTPLGQARLDPADTVVVLDPDALLPAEGRRLLAFVEGRRTARDRRQRRRRARCPPLIPRPPAWSGSGSRTQLAVAGAGATVSGVEEVRGAGEGEWAVTSGYRAPLRGARGGSAAARTEPRPRQDRAAGRRIAAAEPPARHPPTTRSSPSTWRDGRAREWCSSSPCTASDRAAGLPRFRAAGGWRSRCSRSRGCCGCSRAADGWDPRSRRTCRPSRRAPPMCEAIALLLRRTRDPGELATLLTRLRERG